jgi:hypothetical protein
MAKIVPQNGSGQFMWVDVTVRTILTDVISVGVSEVTFSPKMNGLEHITLDILQKSCLLTFWPFQKKATSFGGCHYHIMKEHTFYISKPVSKVPLQFFGVRRIFGEVWEAI